MADASNWPVERNESVRSLAGLPHVVSDDRLVRELAAAFARAPLAPDQVRDVKLVAFLMDLDSGRLAEVDVPERAVYPPLSSWIDALSALGGISKIRVRGALDRLIEAQILVSVPSIGPGRMDFVESVLSPFGAGRWVSWPSVSGVLRGQAASLLVLRAALDLIAVPWEWSRLTHEMVAEHASYSIGMAQKALDHLVDTRVLERSLRVGRGHDYRFSAWALGRGPRPADESVKAIAVHPESSQVTERPSLPQAQNRTYHSGERGVELEVGGLTMQLPEGSSVRMSVDDDGVTWYHIGPDLKVRSRA
jgi:hypothetical protein